jgi:hypothetical protein
VAAKLDAYEKQAADTRSLRKEFAEMSQTIVNLDRRLMNMGLEFSKRMLAIWEGVNGKTEVISEEIRGMRKGLEENDRRYGVIRGFTEEMKMFLGRAKDGRFYLDAKDVIAPMDWEFEEEVDEQPKEVQEEAPIEQEVGPAGQPAAAETMSSSPRSVVVGPSRLPPVPPRNNSRKRSQSAMATDVDDGDGKRQRKE